MDVQVSTRRGRPLMDVAHGFGMLALGMFAIAIGGGVAFYIINNYVNQQKEDDE
tara:strand:- start:513 stop:674 length:162 start_codon:yes stop_codon:yes gene_type:complete